MADYYRGREADYLQDLSLLTRAERLIEGGRDAGVGEPEGYQHTEAYIRMKGALGPPPARYGEET